MTKRSDQQLARVTGRGDWDRLTEQNREARSRSLQALSLMRTEQMSLTTAAAAAGTTPRTVLRYADPALTRTGRRYQATAGDRLYRRMAVVGPEGRIDVDVRGSRK